MLAGSLHFIVDPTSSSSSTKLQRTADLYCVGMAGLPETPLPM
ncbi:hypothetical protein PR003_g10518 [Phytophthora rubi]|uniref:Uncharacterized protein n=1 Tax=Phytophthora rubi TaxID=129364 RepID=A0A6A4FF30_9STRA|nr:hypothetical protein PR001_g10103 [Phytophthora rubi]KAE9340372.1 hypothetical protein PR003_g10518 [Phytophthora rubi]